MPKQIACKQLFPTDCRKVFDGENPQAFMNEVWQHVHAEVRHADIQEELRGMREGRVKKWQDRLVHVWTKVQRGTTEDNF